MKTIACWITMFVSITGLCSPGLVIVPSPSFDGILKAGKTYKIKADVRNGSDRAITFTYDPEHVYAFLDEARVWIDRERDLYYAMGGDCFDFVEGQRPQVFDFDVKTGKFSGTHDAPPELKTVTLPPMGYHPLVFKFPVPSEYPLGRSRLWLTLKTTSPGPDARIMSDAPVLIAAQAAKAAGSPAFGKAERLVAPDPPPEFNVKIACDFSEYTVFFDVKHGILQWKYKRKYAFRGEPLKETARRVVLTNREKRAIYEYILRNKEIFEADRQALYAADTKDAPGIGRKTAGGPSYSFWISGADARCPDFSCAVYDLNRFLSDNAIINKLWGLMAIVNLALNVRGEDLTVDFSIYHGLKNRLAALDSEREPPFRDDNLPPPFFHAARDRKSLATFFKYFDSYYFGAIKTDSDILEKPSAPAEAQ